MYSVCVMGKPKESKKGVGWNFAFFGVRRFFRFLKFVAGLLTRCGLTVM